MFGLGIPELLIILVIVLLIFGANKLPQIGDALGKSIKNFRRSSNAANEIEVGKKKEIAGGSARVSDDDEVEEAEVVNKESKKS